MSSEKENSKTKIKAFKYLEVTLVVAVVIVVWIVMLLPVVIYFLPLGAHPQSGQNSTLIHLKPNNSSNSICPGNFFDDPVNGTSQCKPSCSSWTMYNNSAELASYVLIGIATAIGMLTTIAIIIMSFACFKSMLEFPTVLLIYQDIIVNVHGLNIFIGFADRHLFCTSENLVETYSSPASPYCTFSGIISDFVVLPLTVWILIQISYTVLAVYMPVYFKQLKEKKWKMHLLHIVSIIAGIISLLFPSMLTLGVGGYSPLDSKFPPVVCFARNRDVTVYVFIIPLGILMATIITELILLFRFLMTCSCRRKSNKDLREVEVKVVIICCCYVVVGLAASMSYAISSATLRGLKKELFDYFECERVRDIVGSDQLKCDRSGYESYLIPTTKILGYSFLALYPVITLIYFFSKKKVKDMKHTISNASRSISSRSFTLSGIH